MLHTTTANSNSPATELQVFNRAIELIDKMPDTVMTNHQLRAFLDKNFTMNTSVQRYFLERTSTEPSIITFVWHRNFYYAFGGDAFKLHVLLGYNVHSDEGVLTVCLHKQQYEACQEIANENGLTVRFYN